VESILYRDARQDKDIKKNVCLPKKRKACQYIDAKGYNMQSLFSLQLLAFGLNYTGFVFF
jgi:hypothetical protein